jgi:hypothetical protein
MPGLRIAASIALLASLYSPAALAIPVYGERIESVQRGPESAADPGSPPASFGEPENALGPPDGDVVSLGERGQITLELAIPVGDGPGADLIVLENPFSFVDDSGATFVFAELGFVEVSSDGDIFARFPSASPLLGPIGAFGVVALEEVAQFRGLAGLRPEGDPFDFMDLLDVPVVETGLVDLAAIRFVRIRDVVGDGSEFDGRGNPIFDPWPTLSASSGFDLDSVSGLYPIPEPSTLALLALALGSLVAASAARSGVYRPLAHSPRGE